MFYLKVWLGVILAAALSAQILIMHPRLLEDLSQEQDRLRPVVAGKHVERSLAAVYQRMLQEADIFASDPDLRRALSPLANELEEDKKKATYQQIHRAILDNVRSTQKLDKSFQSLYVVSLDGRLLYKSTKPESYTHERMPKIPHLADALQNRPRTGIWVIEGSNSLVAAVPLFVDAPPPPPRKRKQSDDDETPKAAERKPKGAILYSFTFNSAFLQAHSSILSGEAKGSRMILFAVSKSEDGEQKAAPIAYSTQGDETNFLRGWFVQRASDVVLDKYENGMDRDLLNARIKQTKTSVIENKYSYMVSLFPADLSPGNIGYVLLVPIPERLLTVNTQNYFQTGGPVVFSLATLVIIFVLALWLSGAEIFYFRRVVPRLQTAPQDEFPDIPLSGLSGPWKELTRAINRIFSTIRERGLGEADMKPANTIGSVDDAPAALDFLSVSQSSEFDAAAFSGLAPSGDIGARAASLLGPGASQPIAPPPQGFSPHASSGYPSSSQGYPQPGASPRGAYPGSSQGYDPTKGS